MKTPNSPSLLGIDIGATSIKAASVSQEGKLLTPIRKRTTTTPMPPEVLMRQIGALARKFNENEKVIIGFPGQVGQGVILSPDNLARRDGPGSDRVKEIYEQWVNFPLADEVASLLGCAVVVLNDADVAALGASEGRGVELTVTLGTGIGTGLVIDGVLQPHREYDNVPSFPNLTVDEAVGEQARKTLVHEEWQERLLNIIVDLHQEIEWDQCFLTGGNARRLSRDRLQEVDQSLWVVGEPVGITGAARVAELF